MSLQASHGYSPSPSTALYPSYISRAFLVIKHVLLHIFGLSLSVHFNNLLSSYGQFVIVIRKKNLSCTHYFSPKILIVLFSPFSSFKLSLHFYIRGPMSFHTKYTLKIYSKITVSYLISAVALYTWSLCRNLAMAGAPTVSNLDRSIEINRSGFPSSPR